MSITLSTKHNIAIEVCSYSLESCIAAEKAGANRIELCASPFEGGTTPSAGLMKSAKENVNIQVHVMIRPRGGDFCYTDQEIGIMKADIEIAKQIGCDGIVLGILHPDGQINTGQIKELASLAHPMEVTVHRAFDMSSDPFEALEAIIDCGCTRILTSALQNKVTEGKELLREIVKKADGRIQIMAGSGVNARNAQDLLETGVDALHLTGKSTRDSVMTYRREGIAMGGLSEVPEYEIAYADVEKIRKVVEIVQPVNS